MSETKVYTANEILKETSELFSSTKKLSRTVVTLSVESLIATLLFLYGTHSDVRLGIGVILVYAFAIGFNLVAFNAVNNSFAADKTGSGGTPILMDHDLYNKTVEFSIEDDADLKAVVETTERYLKIYKIINGINGITLYLMIGLVVMLFMIVT